jgi:integrase
MLKCAVEWGEIEQLPVQIKRLRTTNPSMDFYDFEEYEQLLTAARALGLEHLGFVLLAGDAGMRAGEIRGLHWSSVDLSRRLLTVERSEYRGEFTTPKHDKIRTVPMTKRLASVLGELKQAKRSLVFTRNANEPISPSNGRTLIGQALDGAELRQHGPHTLRHTFCSHLAMRGAAARVIQQLAGHSSLITTQRYMHLSPGATEAAIALLECPPPRRVKPSPHVGIPGVGDMLETASHRPPYTP